ncbi:hypothetical protein [Chryseobacterium sp. T1]
MELEFKRVDDFRLMNLNLQNGDYLYEHDKDLYPLNNEFDLTNLYFVTKSLQENLKVFSMVGDKQRTLNLDKLDNNWWVMKLPHFIREKIGLN